MSALHPFNASPEAIARIMELPRVTAMPVRLNPALWPPCHSCKLDVNNCECDSEAVYAAIDARSNNTHEGDE